MIVTKSERFVPLYYRIARDIITRIENGSLGSGDRVPSENEIRAEWRVSSTTARRVLSELVREGWISSEQGKGSFVGKPFINRDIARITSFTHNMEQMGLKPSTMVLMVKRCLGKEKSLTIGGQGYTLQVPYLHIVRLRLGDEVPIMIENRFISLEICPDLDCKDLSKSLFALYESVYGCTLLRSRQSVSAISIDRDIAGQLECPPGHPSFLVEGALFTSRNRLLELESSIYRGDKYRFLIDATGS